MPRSICPHLFSTQRPDHSRELPTCLLLMGGGGTRETLFDLQPLFDEWWRNGVVLPIRIATPGAGPGLPHRRTERASSLGCFIRPPTAASACFAKTTLEPTLHFLPERLSSRGVQRISPYSFAHGVDGYVIRHDMAHVAVLAIASSNLVRRSDDSGPTPKLRLWATPSCPAVAIQLNRRMSPHMRRESKGVRGCRFFSSRRNGLQLHARVITQANDGARSLTRDRRISGACSCIPRTAN